MRRYWVRFHHAAAAAQSYRGSCELPASLASNGRRDALATTFSRMANLCRGPTPPCTCLVLTICRQGCRCLVYHCGWQTLPDSCVRGPTAPSHTSLPTRMPKHASHGSEYPTAPTRSCLTCPRSSQPHVTRRHGPFPWERAPFPPPKREEGTPSPPKGGGGISPPKGG